MIQTWCEQIFQESLSHLNILGTGKVTFKEFLTQDPHILDAMAQNLVPIEICAPLFQTAPIFHRCTGADLD